MILLSGCITPDHTTSIYLLNRRISELENRKDTNIIESEKIIERVVWFDLENGARRKVRFQYINNEWVGERNDYYSEFPSQTQVIQLYHK